MKKRKESFHLMAVPKEFTPAVLEAGGRFLKMKNKQLKAKVLKLIQQNSTPEPMVHILDPSQHRSYEMLGEDHEEDMSICNTVFEQNREGGYRIFQGSPRLANCEDCVKVLKQKNAVA
ncbi:MAG: hypothetical protein HQM13_07875 [SAR324 cluster bacterium]|nr:hypothetical protein [SAR324 cluster bacterium]